MKTILSIIALALIVIAGNLTIQTLNSDPVESYDTDTVVKVLGKYTEYFDGLSIQPGYLVETKYGLDIIPFDEGSLAKESMPAPKFISVYWPDREGRPQVLPASALLE